MDLRTKTIKRAISLLTAAGARFHVIDADQRQQWGSPMQSIKRRRGPNSWSKHADAHGLRDLKPGDLATVPYKGAPSSDRRLLATRVANLCHSRFGKGNYTVGMNGVGVDVLRVN